MKIFIYKFIVLIFSSLIIGSNNSIAHKDNIRSIIKFIQEKYAPDKRTAVFKIFYKQTNKKIFVKGEVDNIEAKNALIDTLKKSSQKEICENILLLPDSTLGRTTNGIITVELCNMKKEPIEQSELVSQALMGTVVKILKVEENYFYVQTPDKYLGWIDTGAIIRIDEDGLTQWNNTHKVIITKISGVIREKPEFNSKNICEVSIGCVLKYDSKLDDWVIVELANGKRGYLSSDLCQDYDQWKQNFKLTSKNIGKTAKLFLGVPYLWGGMSAKGMDCSGFVKLIYWLNGYELNRDANQQAEQGINVEVGNNSDNYRKGDLLFFGQRKAKNKREMIKHVGIYLEKGLFIHSREKVQYSSLNPNSKYFDKSLSKNLVRVRRIIQE